MASGGGGLPKFPDPGKSCVSFLGPWGGLTQGLKGSFWKGPAEGSLGKSIHPAGAVKQGRQGGGGGGGNVSPLVEVGWGRKVKECQVVINISHGRPLLTVNRAGREKNLEIRAL